MAPHAKALIHLWTDGLSSISGAHVVEEYCGSCTLFSDLHVCKLAACTTHAHLPHIQKKQISA